MLVSEQDYLSHYGILGIKWGVRKDDNKVSVPSRKEAKAQTRLETYNKAAKVKEKALSREERKMAGWAMSSPKAKLARAVGTAVVSTIIGDYMSGATKGYRHMNASGVITRLAGIGMEAGGRILANNAASKTYLKGYSNSGNVVKGNFGKTLSGSMKAKFGAYAAMAAGATSRMVVGVADYKLGKIMSESSRNRAKVNSRLRLSDGRSIWQQPLDNFVTIR